MIYFGGFCFLLLLGFMFLVKRETAAREREKVKREAAEKAELVRKKQLEVAARPDVDLDTLINRMRDLGL